jgi:hypothetical protein
MYFSRIFSAAQFGLVWQEHSARPVLSGLSANLTKICRYLAKTHRYFNFFYFYAMFGLLI